MRSSRQQNVFSPGITWTERAALSQSRTGAFEHNKGSAYNTEARVEAGGANGAKIAVTWAGSPWFHDQITMCSPFDPEMLTMTITNLVPRECICASSLVVAEEKAG